MRTNRVKGLDSLDIFKAALKGPDLLGVHSGDWASAVGSGTPVGDPYFFENPASSPRTSRRMFSRWRHQMSAPTAAQPKEMAVGPSCR